MANPDSPDVSISAVYIPDDEITTDWDLFLAHARAAEHAPSREAIEHYRHALELIDGPPFHDVPTGYSWAYSDGTATEITDTIQAVARQAAELHHTTNDPDGATWAINRARRAFTSDEECPGLAAHDRVYP